MANIAQVQIKSLAIKSIYESLWSLKPAADARATKLDANYNYLQNTLDQLETALTDAGITFDRVLTPDRRHITLNLTVSGGNPDPSVTVGLSDTAWQYIKSRMDKPVWEPIEVVEKAINVFLSLEQSDFISE